MSEYERILMECRYLLSLDKSLVDLANKFNIDESVVYHDLVILLPTYDSLLSNRVKSVLNNKNCT